MSNILAKFGERVQQSGVPERVGHGVQATMGAVEHTKDPRLLFMSDHTGRPSRHVAAETAVQSLATVPTVQKYMDRFIDSQYGQLLPALGDNPAVKQQLMRVPFLKSGLDAVMDRLGEKQFDASRSRALSQAGAVTEQLTDRYEQLSQKASGEDLGRRAMELRARFRPDQRFDKHDLVREARREAQYTQGRDISAQEADAIKNLAGEIQKGAYDTRGLHRVYSRKAGGLSAQRARTGLGIAGESSAVTKQRASEAGAAVGEAQQKMQQILHTPPPQRRARGGRINVGTLMENLRQPSAKQAGATMIAACFRNICDKLAGTTLGDENLVDILSTTDFKEREQTRPRTIIRRTLHEDGGIPDIIQEKLYSSDRTRVQKKSSLEFILKKMKKELYFKDKVEYTTKGN